MLASILHGVDNFLLAGEDAEEYNYTPSKLMEAPFFFLHNFSAPALNATSLPLNTLTTRFYYTYT
jgi:hypothetical protein